MRIFAYGHKPPSPYTRSLVNAHSMFHTRPRDIVYTSTCNDIYIYFPFLHACYEHSLCCQHPLERNIARHGWQVLWTCFVRWRDQGCLWSRYVNVYTPACFRVRVVCCVSMHFFALGVMVVCVSARMHVYVYVHVLTVACRGVRCLSLIELLCTCVFV